MQLVLARFAISTRHTAQTCEIKRFKLQLECIVMACHVTAQKAANDVSRSSDILKCNSQGICSNLGRKKCALQRNYKPSKNDSYYIISCSYVSCARVCCNSKIYRVHRNTDAGKPLQRKYNVYLNYITRFLSV